MNARTGKALRIAVELALLGLIVFLFLRSLDVAQLRAGVFLITPGVVIGIIGFQLAILALGTVCWAFILREAGIYRGPWRTFLARVSGFSMTYLTPSVSFGGVPARAGLYMDHGMRGETLYATIVIDTFIELAGKIPCIAIGLFFLVPRARSGMTSAVAVGSVVMLCMGVFVFLTVKALSGGVFFVKLAECVRRTLERINAGLAVRLSTTLRAFAADLDAIVHNRVVILYALLTAAGIAVVEVLQTLFILQALGEAGIDRSLAIFSSVLFQAIFGVLPGNLGGMEGTHAFVFGLLGMEPASGLIYTVILRIGQTAMVLLGILNILYWRISKALTRSRALDSRAAAVAARASALPLVSAPGVDGIQWVDGPGNACVVESEHVD